MPQKDGKLYSRGRYRLAWDRKRDGSERTPYLQIVWYDDDTKRQRSRSTGTTDKRDAAAALDRLYLERENGVAVCSECGRPLEGGGGYLVKQAIDDYQAAKEGVVSFDALKARARLAKEFLEETGRIEMPCERMDEGVIAGFRAWAAARPVVAGGVARPRAPGTIEASVTLFASAINLAHRRRDTLYPAGFTALPARKVSRSPTFRLSVEQLAAMFRYCVRPSPPPGEEWGEARYRQAFRQRRPLLRFLQASVSTWARPDAVHDISTAPERDQWIGAARVLRLNPRGRVQTSKHRPEIPVPERFAAILDQTDGFLIGVKSIRKAFEAMIDTLELRVDRETGVKLIRRSVSQLARPIIGEAQWRQGEIMLGHHRASISDLYAMPDPANLGRALAATNAIIDAIEGECSGAFTGNAPELSIRNGGLNA